MPPHPHPHGHDEPHEPRGASEREQGDQAAGILRQLSRRVNRARSWVHARPGGAQIWRVGTALAGLLVIVVGIVLLAVPGPGWLIIFLGLGIWAMEFEWAKSLLIFARRTVRAWTAWVERQPRWLVVLVAAVGLIILGAAAASAWVLIASQ